ncbi:MAG: DUF6460 domain-containing protein [Hyphomicrobiaceae bacterium]
MTPHRSPVASRRELWYREDERKACAFDRPALKEHLDMDREQIFGGNPLGVLVRLVIISIVVGIVLQALNISPPDLLYRLELMIRNIYEMGFGAFRGLINYFLIGAVVVIPIWLIARLLGVFRNRGGK